MVYSIVHTRMARLHVCFLLLLLFMRQSREHQVSEHLGHLGKFAPSFPQAAHAQLMFSGEVSSTTWSTDSRLFCCFSGTLRWVGPEPEDTDAADVAAVNTESGEDVREKDGTEEAGDDDLSSDDDEAFGLNHLKGRRPRCSDTGGESDVMHRNEEDADRAGTNAPNGANSSEVTADATVDLARRPDVLVVGAEKVEERDIPLGRFILSEPVRNCARSR